MSEVNLSALDSAAAKTVDDADFSKSVDLWMSSLTMVLVTVLSGSDSRASGDGSVTAHSVLR